jgi:hypothetical protein
MTRVLTKNKIFSSKRALPLAWKKLQECGKIKIRPYFIFEKIRKEW